MKVDGLDVTMFVILFSIKYMYMKVYGLDVTMFVILSSIK